ncbi:MAG: rhomboid family intramembrane serine protease [Spirosomaceae bacterium]|nr:rhomboid family intramembrane serine protease [Spirosomataceae bacterium]
MYINFSFGNAITKIILVNLFVFVGLMVLGFFLSFSDATQSINQFIQRQFVLNAPLKEFIFQPWTLLTYSFHHDGFFHILFNMITLYWFGMLLQDFIGGQKLVNIYLLGGILGGLIYIFVHNLLALAPESFGINNISASIGGASAAVFAVLFATITLVPDYEFFFFRLFLVKIKYVAWAFLLLSFLNPSSGISHAAGAFVGFGYIKLLRSGLDLGSPIEGIYNWWKSLGGKKTFKTPTKSYTKSPVYVSTATKTAVSGDYFPGQSEVDAILDKIGKSGYESLSKEEKEILYRASQQKD